MLRPQRPCKRGRVPYFCLGGAQLLSGGPKEGPAMPLWGPSLLCGALCLILSTAACLPVRRWLIERVWRAEPAPSRHFTWSLLRRPLITSKRDYFSLLDSSSVWNHKTGRRWVCRCDGCQKQGLDDRGAWERDVRWDRPVHTSAVTPPEVLRVRVTFKCTLIDVTGRFMWPLLGANVFWGRRHPPSITYPV